MEGKLSSETIKAEAKRLGFSACGLSAAAPVSAEHARRMKAWLKAGRHAGMAYLADHYEKKLDPRRVVEGAKTIVSVALNYYTGQPLAADGYAMARYALGKDYHDVMRAKLRQLLQAIGLTEHQDGRVFCDTAPIDERYWAVQGGLGWQGRSGQLVIPGAGTYFFLGELVLLREADRYDRPIPPRCGTCRCCLDACPAGALLGDGTLDARRCLSYLTIEHRGSLPPGTGRLMHGCFYGCDRCAEACPWNQFAAPTAEAAFYPSSQLSRMSQTDWQHLSVEQYRALFKGSAVKRAKYEGIMRNIQALSAAAAEQGDGEEGG